MFNQLSLTPINASEGRFLGEFEIFLRQLGRSEETIHVYVWGLRKYFKCLAQKLDDMSGAAVWLNWNESAQVKRVTGYALRAYREFMGEFHPELAIHFYVPTHLPPKTKPDPKPIHMPDEVVCKLNRITKNFLPYDSYLSLRVYVTVLRELGVRRSEAAGIGWNDINWVERSVVIHGKGNKNRTLPLSRKLCRMFAILRSRSAVSPWIGAKGQVLSSKCLAYLFKEVAKQAGLGSLKCHAFRTTKLTEIGNMRDFNPLLYQAFSGHADLSTAKYYVRPALDRMREMLRVR